ncbi:Conserved oligomeric Golgi complex subunit 8 [Monoraphidium neglectum]|uniref:Conserved oligomeric Golgi complex subunit 8 n=1 Tax=Monoraphidium neglectum TaxID=145388 RepID=A0A0D2MN03_9CHLO|nr:Conserved oligomeric Golgi complex subunit 8 [Monoraphidium neglectum]KIZ04110.1 Conserved oligomeric Golgi complex subunit 8 [Monoraphidium neglectum]|eukprot:XP_013903129.1 Conserved oligomeric Golgi complex subunit 8 [Monoraphidium neglectum]
MSGMPPVITGRPSIGTAPLLHAGSAGGPQLQRRGSLALQGGSPTAAAGKHADVYLTELLSYSLDRLRKEPELLAEERHQLERALQASALTHYRALIDGAECLGSVRDALADALARLEALQEDAPKLSATCEAFSRDAAAVLAQRAANKQLLAQQATLLELLEAPQLMDTCVRNGIYDEALDLAAFINRLGLLHPELPIIQLLQRQAAEVSASMLSQLLQRLRGSIQLPECLRVIGYLRRMAAYSEGDLRLQFLSCREQWFSGLVAELDEGDSYEYVKALTDVYRLNMFDVLMQYRAIFFDAPQEGKPQAGARDSAALHSWVQHRVAAYLAALRAHLPNVTEGGGLASVLEHCNYCGASLSRVGLDFRALLAPVLELVTLQLFGSCLAVAVDAFTSRLDSHKWVAMPAPMFKQQQQQQRSDGGGEAGPPGGEQAAQRAEGNANGGGGGGAGDDLSPPYALMENLPLAVLTNGVLSALNEIRHCSLLALRRPMAALLQASLERAAGALAQHRAARPLGEGELVLFKAAVHAHGEHL